MIPVGGAVAYLLVCGMNAIVRLQTIKMMDLKPPPVCIWQRLSIVLLSLHIFVHTADIF